jgi:hypothetical protein
VHVRVNVRTPAYLSDELLQVQPCPLLGEYLWRRARRHGLRHTRAVGGGQPVEGGVGEEEDEVHCQRPAGRLRAIEEVVVTLAGSAVPCTVQFVRLRRSGDSPLVEVHHVSSFHYHHLYFFSF